MTQPNTSAIRSRRNTILGGAAVIVALGVVMNTTDIPGTNISFAVPYAAEGPGPTFDTLGEIEGEEVIDIQGVDTEETAGQLDMTTVSVRTNMSFTQAVGRWLFSNDTMVPIHQIIPPDSSPEDVREANEAAFVQSESAATVAAMNHLGRPTNTVVARVFDEGAAVGHLEEDDVLVAIDGTEVTYPEEVAEYVQSHQPGDRLVFTVERDGTRQDETITLGASSEDENLAAVGILMRSEPADDIQVDYNLQDVGGPSAGMIFSLAVIDKLTPGALTGGTHVAGTGTISPSGEVGPIGGAGHKVRAAAEAGAELFLAPEDNCAEAVRSQPGGIVVAAVTDLDSAIAAMDAFAAGQPVTECQAS